MSTPSVHLRDAEDRDAARLSALYAQLGDPARTADAAAVRRLLAATAQRPGYRIIVAERDGCVVASYTHIVVPVAAYPDTNLCLVESVVVDAAERGAGLGRALMAHAMQEARAARCYKLMLSSNHQRTDAHAFYRRLGFAEHGRSFAVEVEPCPVASST